MARLTFVLFTFAFLITWSPVAAQETADPDDIPLLGEEYEAMLDEAREDVSEWLIGKVLWFDSFFDDENYVSEINKTRLKLSLSLGYSKKEDFEAKIRASLRIRLPKLENKVNLIIAGSDDTEFDTREAPISAPDLERNELAAGIQYFLREKVDSNVSVSAGFSWDYLYAGLRYRYSMDIGEWRSRFVNYLRWYTDDGWEDKASVEFDRLLSERFLFRTTLAAEWFENENGLPHSVSFRLYQFLNKEKALEYDIACLFDTRPDYTMTDTQLRVKYRQRFYRDWLALEISPFVTFPEEDDREANPGIVFKLEVILGLSPGDTFESVFNL